MKTLILFVASKELSGTADKFSGIALDYESAIKLADEIHEKNPNRLIELKVYSTNKQSKTKYLGGCEFYSSRGIKYDSPYRLGTLDCSTL